MTHHKFRFHMNWKRETTPTPSPAYISKHQRLHYYRSEWTKVPSTEHPPPTIPTWSNQWLHMKKLQPAMAPCLPHLHKATLHVLQVQKHVPAFDAFQKILVPTCHVFGTTRWTKPAECAFRNQWRQHAMFWVPDGSKRQHVQSETISCSGNNTDYDSQ